MANQDQNEPKPLASPPLMKIKEIHKIGTYKISFWQIMINFMTQQKQSQQSVIILLQPIPEHNRFKQVKTNISCPAIKEEENREAYN